MIRRAIAAVSALLFIVLAIAIRFADVRSLDAAIVRTTSEREPTMVVKLVNDLGGPFFVFPAAFLLTIVVWAKHRRSDAAFVGVTMLAMAGLNLAARKGFHRLRPDVWNTAGHSFVYSFPSGHATISTSLVLVTLLVFPRRRWMLVTASVYLTSIAATTLMRGVHYPTDLVAGWAFATFFVCVSREIFDGWTARPTPPS